MNTAVETLSATRVKLSIEVAADEMKPSIDAAYKRIAAAINVPGFRKGKVPQAIIDQRVGREAVIDEAMNDVISNAYADAVRDNELRVLGQPEVDIAEFVDGQPLSFTAEVEVRPEITLPEYKGIAVSVDDVEASEADIEAQVERLRERFGSLKPVERAVQDGDFIVIDLSSAYQGEAIEEATAAGLSYQVGSGDLLDGLDDAIIGLEAGASGTLTTRLRAGEWVDKDVEVTVEVKSVRERILPELNDEFAQMASEFDTFAELHAQISEQTVEIKKIEQALQARNKIGDALLELVEIPIPEGIVKAEVDEHLQGEGRMEDDVHRAEVDVDVRKAIAQQFLLDEIAKAEDIQASETELTEYLIRQASRYGMAPDQFVQEVVRAGQVASFVGEVVRGKAMAFVLENAAITDASGRTVELKALDASDDDHDGHDHEGHNH
jgi:trigger factor